MTTNRGETRNRSDALSIRGFWLAFAVGILLSAMMVPGARPALGDTAEKTSLSIALFPRRDAAITIRMYQHLADHLSEALGWTVTVHTAPNFEAFLASIARDRYDLLHLNQYQYVQVARDHGYRAILQSEESGRTTISGALYSAKSKGLETLEDLRGKTILFGGGPTAMMSYVVPKVMLARAGLKPGDYQERFSVSPPNAILAAALGQVDAAGIGDVVIELPVVADRIDASTMHLVAMSDPMPHLPWAVSPALEPQLVERLTEALLALQKTETGHAVMKEIRLTGLNPAQDSDYDIFRSIIAEAEALD